MRGYAIAAVQTEVGERLNADAPNACDITAPAASTTLHQIIPFSIELPSDFVIEDQATWDAEFTRGG